ncbi:hypothetical protein [Streptomyces sp. NPDC050804]|uniref:hypothetical protein n=1 Tax=Streptomyces sp. NPDC050804 TaxID=3154745 RepID=UPI003442836E
MGDGVPCGGTTAVTTAVRGAPYDDGGDPYGGSAIRTACEDSGSVPRTKRFRTAVGIRTAVRGNGQARRSARTAL